MAERVVVSLHVRVAASGPEYLRRALTAKKRAEALGAMLTAWGADALAFDFAPEEIEEAIDLALATFDEAPAPEARFAAGVAYGELTRIGSTGSLAMLAWGPALVTAWTLARAAEPGEVLLDEACPSHLRHGLRMQGERRVAEVAHPALVLDTRQPFRRDTLVDALHAESETKVVVTVPPLPPLLGLARDLLDRPPSTKERRASEPPPTLRTDRTHAVHEGEIAPMPPLIAPVSGPSLAMLVREAQLSSSEPPSSDAQEGETIDLEETPSELPASSEVESDGPPSLEDDDLLLLRGVVPPPRLPPARMAPSVPPPGFTGDPGSVPPLAASRISWPGTSEEYVELAAAARQALLKGNVTELERLSDELKTRGDHDDLAERMAGFVAWNRGAKAEGLRKLRAAADAETRPAHRVRALLAYGVALAASGRTDAALLAALGAIARAREVSDRQGEHVCARFLARLSAASGYQRAARTWAMIAEEVGAPRPA